MEKDLVEFIEQYLAEVKPVSREMYLLHWEYDTTGNEELVSRKRELETQYLKIYSNTSKLEKLREFKKSGQIQDPLLKQQLERLHNTFQIYHGNPERIGKIVQLESEITSAYNHFRGKIDGKPHNDNQIKKILRTELDSEKRKKAWEASKQIGQEVAHKVIELVHIRNERARAAGYSDYYAMALKLKDLSEEKLFYTLNRLFELTNEPFREMKSQIDQEKAEQFKISVEDLRPWHYGDPFFQEVPPHGNVEMDHFFTDTNIEELTEKTFQSIDMEVREIMESSDLYPKEGKCQHAYCTFIDREAKDVRILCNVDNTERWVSTMLHEFGHAVYDKYISPDLPYLLQDTPHTLSTEAIAMMMDSLSKNPKWLVEMAKLSPDEVDKIKDQIINLEREGQFVFIRWGLVMVHFEREMYKNPDQDLNKLWWDMVEKYQFVNRPENREAPDWAAKIHLALCPVYYQNYIYGELVSAQLKHYIQENVGNGQLYNNPALGSYLIDEYFALGARYDWNSTLEHATKEKLHPEYFVKETLNISLN